MGDSSMTVPFDRAIICPITIGRQRELDLLDQLIAQAIADRGQTLLVAGEAGIGKS